MSLCSEATLVNAADKVDFIGLQWTCHALIWHMIDVVQKRKHQGF